MSKVLDNLKYTKEHEWIKFDSENEITVGITDYAQEALGDVVFVELPQSGHEAETGSSVATIESVKAVSDIYSPLDGVITDTNNTIKSDPAVVNREPYGNGWLFKMKLSGKSDGLLSAAEYQQILNSL